MPALPLPNRIAKGIDRRLAPLFARNDGLSLAYERLSLALSPAVRKRPIVLFQFGRVGSHTIEESLEARLHGIRIHHVHFLTPEGNEEYNRPYRNNPYFKHRSQRLYVRNEFLYRQIKATLHSEPWQVITGVRDPIERNVSWFFTMLLDRWPKTRAKERLAAGQREELVTELIEIFHNELDHDEPLRWFDEEMKTVFDVDVYAEPFDPQKGYHIYDQRGTRVLLIRLESLNHCAASAFKDFLGIEDLVLASTPHTWNQSVLYKRFREDLVIPDSYIERMYNSAMARHFYTGAELEKFREKWSRNRVAAAV